MDALAELAQSLPQVEKVHIPLITYIEVVKEGLASGDCTLCFVCDEPRWKHCIGNHRCFAVSVYYNADIRLERKEHD